MRLKTSISLTEVVGCILVSVVALGLIARVVALRRENLRLHQEVANYERAKAARKSAALLAPAESPAGHSESTAWKLLDALTTSNTVVIASGCHVETTAPEEHDHEDGSICQIRQAEFHVLHASEAITPTPRISVLYHERLHSATNGCALSFFESTPHPRFTFSGAPKSEDVVPSGPDDPFGAIAAGTLRTFSGGDDSGTGKVALYLLVLDEVRQPADPARKRCFRLVHAALLTEIEADDDSDNPFRAFIREAERQSAGHRE